MQEGLIEQVAKVCVFVPEKLYFMKGIYLRVLTATQ